MSEDAGIQVVDEAAHVGGFKRAYKACVSCRKSKAKCDVGPGSNACTRCRREQRECIFPLQRSAKRKRISTDPGDAQGVKNTRHDKKAKASHSHDSVIVPEVQTQSHESVLTHTVVRSSNDAIGLLFSAANDGQESDGYDDYEDEETRAEGNFAESTPHSNWTSAVSPGKALLCHTTTENLQLWSQHRFVRQGWFSAREAITYIDLFFKKMSHLSPVADYYYADHKNHKRLILEEPLLCCTLLMISSRYHVLPGPGGLSRAEFIHQRLWKHCEHLLQRILFGMEKYSIAKTRTLGSIKALLLMTEWHPRALHFPPENDGWDASLAPSIDDSYNMHDRSTDINRRWREEVFEPAKRSDRMSWMMIGLACTLGHELGVFEHDEGHAEVSASSDLRQIRRQLYLYATQLSLRIGSTNILGQAGPPSYSTSPKRLKETPESSSHDREMMLNKWIEITKLLKTTSEVFFTTLYRDGLKKTTLNKRYLSLIEHFEPLLSHWHESFKLLELSTVNEAAKQILVVEYHYVRMFVSSTAMQALVERIGDRSSNDLWRDHDFLRKEHAQDFSYVSKVRDSSCQIVAMLTTLAENDILHYCPVRVFLRLVTASILLLKSISLGSRDQDVVNSLDTLDRCIAALKSKKTDDMHLSTRYGTLIARHVRRFRKTLRVQKGTGRMMESGLTLPSLARNMGSRAPLNEGITVPESFSANHAGELVDSSDPTSESLEMIDGSSIEAWLAQPFDPDVAPFGFDLTQPASGLNLDSLDFLWNLPGSQ